MLQNERLAIFRSATPAAPGLPLRVRSVGRYQLAQGWSDELRKKWFMELFWGVSGTGEFRVGKRWVTLEPGHIFIYRPGDAHQVRAVSDGWRYCWVTFDHREAERWFKGFGLNRGLQPVGPCPEDLFLDIAQALRRATLQGELDAANLGHQLLQRAAVPTKPSPPDSLPARAKALIDARFRDPQFTVAALADELAVHRSTLFRQFADAQGLSPSAYLQNLRLQRGLALLRASSQPIQEAALAAGFTDPNYFARAVRQATGMSPRALRRS